MRTIMEITGTTPLVYHNIRLADKQDPIVKEIAEINKKGKNKTPEDQLEIEHLEFLGGLYYDKGLGVYMPTWNIVRSLETGARITREGATVIRAVVVLGDRVPLVYNGPRTPEELWAQPEFRLRRTVGVQRDRVTRMRPIFREWSLTFEAEVLTDVIDPEALARIGTTAGLTAGLGDARKLGYGRYKVEMA